MWGRRHPYVNLSFLGIFNFSAPYLPWVLLAFSVTLRSNAVVDLLGIVAGARARRPRSACSSLYVVCAHQISTAWVPFMSLLWRCTGRQLVALLSMPSPFHDAQEAPACGNCHVLRLVVFRNVGMQGTATTSWQMCSDVQETPACGNCHMLDAFL